MFSKQFLFTFGLVVFFGLCVCGSVCARQVLTDGQRQSIMDREMDCVEKAIRSGEVSSWKDTCLLDRPATRDDVVKLGAGYSYDRNGSAPKRSFPSDTYSDWSDEYKYSKYAAVDKGHFSDSPEPMRRENTPKKENERGRFLQASFRIVTGYRRDDFNWNIASDLAGTATPNIISELTWSDMKMTQLKAEGNVTLADHFVFDIMTAYADIYKGDNQDSDYAGNYRTGEYSRSNNASDDGNAMDLSGGLGYRFFIGSERNFLVADDMWLTLLGGYSYHELNLIMTEGYQTIPDSGSFAGLHSSYWAEWEGPWLGFELEGSKDKFFGVFRFEYHWADYYGSANWNLRQDFLHPVSYDQWADGRGLVFNLGAGYDLAENWDVNLRIDFQSWQTDPGIVRFMASDGTKPQQRLNEVNWDSRAFMFGSTYHF